MAALLTSEQQQQEQDLILWFIETSDLQDILAGIDRYFSYFKKKFEEHPMIA